MTAQARHIVFRTSKADATPADVERCTVAANKIGGKIT